MKKLIGLSLGLSLLSACPGVTWAQEKTAGVEAPPHVLVIEREFLKPGKDGSLHEKTESAFVRAMTAAKSAQHYFAMTSLSGETRALFLMGFDSYADWEKSDMAVEHNTALSAELDRAAIADGDLLNREDQSVWQLDKDESLNSDGSIAQMRYMEMTVFKMRPGHHKEWVALNKIFKDAYANVPGSHWAMFESEYGPENGEYLLARTMKSLAEIDQEDLDAKQVHAALGEDGLKKARELEAACVEGSQSELFRFSPKMSYAPEAWIKEDPGFWKPKVEAPMKKEAAKPAPAQ